jgi:hypothetical protein
MADDPATEAAKKRLAEERELQEKSRAEYAERQKGKPTPTQEENDIAALGGHVLEHEDDGSGPEPGVQTRQSEAKRPSGGGYQTRTHRPTPASSN